MIGMTDEFVCIQSVSFGERVMKWILAVSGFAVVVLLSAALALALVHPHNSSGNNTALSGILLLHPSKCGNQFTRGEVIKSLLTRFFLLLN